MTIEGGWIRKILKPAIMQIMAATGPDRVPKSRAMYASFMVSDMHVNRGIDLEEAQQLTAIFMRDIESDIGQFGDPDYEWSLGAMREVLDEYLEDR